MKSKSAIRSRRDVSQRMGELWTMKALGFAN